MANDKEILLWKRQRQGFRLNCTREITKSNDYLDADSDVSTDRVQTSLTVLRDYRVKLEKLDADILLHIEGDDEATAEIEAAADYDYKLLEHISALSTKLESSLSAAVAAATASGDRAESAGGNVSRMSASGHRYGSVKLPKLHLAKFGGDPLKWAEFWDSFSTTIHENGDLIDVEKFKYLRSFLQGDALRLVDGYRLTSANYNEAVDSLSERFGNKQLAIFSHFESMLDISVANHDTQQLQTVYDDCEKHIRSLVALGLEEGTFGQVFTPIILSKLPMYVKMELHRRNGSKTWELSNLRQYLKEEIRARDYSQRTFGGSPGTNRGDGNHNQQHNNNQRGKQQHQHAHRAPPFRRVSGHNQATSAALITHDRPKLRCGFCSEAHFSDQCKKFPDIEGRKRCLQGRCFVCLSDKHVVKDCTTQRPCAHCGKQGHHRSLCYTKFRSSPQFRKATPDASLHVVSDSSCQQPPVVNSSLLSHGETAILQTALSTVKGEGSIGQARILFDTGCSRSFVTSDLCKKIRARHIGQESTSIAGFADTKRKTMTYKTVEFDVLLPAGGKRTITANVIPTISCPIQKLPLDVKSYPTLLQIALAEPLVSQTVQINIDILLGSDYYYDFVGSERMSFSNGMILLSSVLGFIATGRVPSADVPINGVTSLFFSTADSHPDATVHVERFWSLEDIGIKSPTVSNDDEDALATFNSTVRYEDGRYQVKLPWKSEEKLLPDNYHLAAGRLKSLLKRIASQPEVLQKYDDTIRDQLSKGIVEVAPAVPTGDRVHYIPHHCVVTPNKTTTKLRIVYDASAKASKTSPSLNDCLNRGPVMLDDLCGLIIKFRTHPIGLVGDIEKAFLQIGLQDSERDVTRFLWVKDVTKDPVGENMAVLRFCRVLFGAISSPFLLAAVIKHHLDKSKSPAASAIDGCIYVDNVITGKSSSHQAIEFYRSARELFADASMNLREWFTNSQVVRDAMRPEDRGETDITKVLGLTWNTVVDTISCGSFTVQMTSVNTKRLMLKYLAKVFDPCGYFSAVTVTGKLLIQQLWETKFDWDDPLPTDVVRDWEKCSDSLQRIATYQIPRCYDAKIGSKHAVYKLHCFCDASGKAYAAVVYLTITTESETTSNIVFAKSRVGPIKKLSIPRMELMAAVVGVRILSFVNTTLGLPIAEQYLWSDSQCILHWLVKRSLETVFVKNRVNEIISHRDVSFRYVPTNVNPADLSSRGCSFDTLMNSAMWWHGPTWLIKPSSHWPNNPVPTAKLEDRDAVNMLDEQLHNKHETDVNVVDGTSDSCPIDYSRFSSLKRLLRVTAWVKRFIYNIRVGKRSGPLTARELGDAQLFWDRHTQRRYFSNVILSVTDAKTKHLIQQLNLYMDDNNMIRCRGRIDAADVTSDVKHPKLLPKYDHYTFLIIADCHERLGHSGVSHTLSRVRHQYWIIHGRSQVKAVVNRCYICRLIHGGPYRYPDPPSLPDFRVCRQKPFATVGIDYLGPLFVNNDSGEQSKVWICLFTCAVIRAVHLEVVDNLSACQFVMCLRRFVARYGCPRLIISDNATHFHKTSQYLSKLWREIQHSTLVQDYASGQGITWKFIIELSPWMGGFYERMVGIVKMGLKKTLDIRHVSLIELQTVVSEIAAIVNSRPLVYVDADLTQPSLTPSHFLGGPCDPLPSADIPTDDYSPKRVTNNDLIILWRRISKLLDNFWQIWQDQYLLSLRERGYYSKQRNTSDIKPTVGTVVIIKDKLPRKHWRIGRVVDLPVGRDGVCRSAVLRLANNKTMNRPLRLLYPLEQGSVDGETNPGKATTPPDNTGRVRRRAFIRANQRLREASPQDTSDSEPDDQ